MEAIAAALSAALPGAHMATEPVSAPPLPCCHIRQASLSQREERRGRWWLEYGYEVAYVHAAEPPMGAEHQRELDSAAERLMAIDRVEVRGSPVPVRRPAVEKGGGALSYTFGLTLQAAKPEEEAARQRTLAASAKPKGKG